MVRAARWVIPLTTCIVATTATKDVDQAGEEDVASAEEVARKAEDAMGKAWDREDAKETDENMEYHLDMKDNFKHVSRSDDCGEEFQPVTSEAKCQEYARSANKNYIRSVDLDFVPHGCYSIRYGDKVFLNVNKGGRWHKKATKICEKSPAPPPEIVGYSAQPTTNVEADWENFKKGTQKKYPTKDEEQLRKRIFKHNRGFVMEKNKLDEGYTLAINSFSDLTIQEFRNTFTGVPPSEDERVFKEQCMNKPSMLVSTCNPTEDLADVDDDNNDDVFNQKESERTAADEAEDEADAKAAMETCEDLAFSAQLGAQTRDNGFQVGAEKADGVEVTRGKNGVVDAAVVDDEDLCACSADEGSCEFGNNCYKPQWEVCTCMESAEECDAAGGRWAHSCQNSRATIEAIQSSDMCSAEKEILELSEDPKRPDERSKGRRLWGSRRRRRRRAGCRRRWFSCRRRREPRRRQPRRRQTHVKEDCHSYSGSRRRGGHRRRGFSAGCSYQRRRWLFGGRRRRDITPDEHKCTATMPKTFDWQNSDGVVTEVKNQGQCGSCWAFASQAAMESAHEISCRRRAGVGKGDTNLAEQWLVDCNWAQYGCSGGWPCRDFDFIRSRSGSPTEADYRRRYNAMNGACSWYPSTNLHQVWGGGASWQTAPYHYVARGVPDLMSALVRQPVVIYVRSNSGWSGYSSGILGGGCGGSVDHAVLLTAYGTNYWKAKNSWGTWWGENGFIRFAKGIGGSDGSCVLAMSPVYPNALCR